MCDCNFKNPNLGAFFKRLEKNKKESESISKNVIVKFEFALRV